ncbi:GNAT family N-acetyltransferase [Salinigranum rubrum]|uniref:GNAT family N-acetyltransferase n=1 Tax=Salinigranum rubrum TaxID=755307 RepID=A0A2I8VKF2_9EURY|nr:GNAT family N-acetyltransferase [Salinigranum rubrum]AUV82401.1 GNAT family N-acetyltransferase [Salinigranum rubrum]
MDIVRLPDDEAALRRFLETLWLPYSREREAHTDGFALAEDVDLVAEELEHRLSRHQTESYRAWVAIDGTHDATRLADTDAEFVGFVTTDIDESPSVFDRPDRLVIADIYVLERYRGTGLARALVDRARTRARESGCTEVKLEVDVDNDRALAFYEKIGFETVRYTMSVSV